MSAVPASSDRAGTSLRRTVSKRIWVAGIIPAAAAVAQLVEHELPKLGVAGSIPVYRSLFSSFVCRPQHVEIQLHGIEGLGSDSVLAGKGRQQ